MKINTDKTSDFETARTRGKSEVSRSIETSVQSNNKPAPASSDKIDVSNRAANVGKMVEKLNEMPDVRQEKVEALRQKIEAGEYKPSADAIADAILKDEN